MSNIKKDEKKSCAWERAGLKSEHEYRNLLERLGYKEAIPDDYVPGMGFKTVTLLHIGKGVFAAVEPIDQNQRSSFEMPM